jgi:hypothetical protein
MWPSRRMWNHLQYTPTGQRLARAPTAEATVKYAHGPLFRVKEADKVTVVATFQTELRGKKKNFPAVMFGSPAVVLGRSGRGTVCLVSPNLIESDAVNFPQTLNLLRHCRWVGHIHARACKHALYSHCAFRFRDKACRGLLLPLATIANTPNSDVNGIWATDEYE